MRRASIRGRSSGTRCVCSSKGVRIITGAAPLRVHGDGAVREIVASDPGDKDMLFDPMEDKVYRHPTFYKLPDAVDHM